MLDTVAQFKYIELADLPAIRPYLFREGEDTCEISPANLLIWQRVYGFKTALVDGVLLFNSQSDEGTMYRLPICDDFEHGMEVLYKVAGTRKPILWAAEGERLDKFLAHYAQDYELLEDDDGGDYLYLREDLANLAGKKYQAKRNHISAFSREYAWRFEPLSKQNADDVRRCAKKWYAEHADRLDPYMQAEKAGVELLLSNIETLHVKGGLIYVGDEAVAFTMGTPINSHAFDIHIEKALAEYATAYAVINREFVRSLEEGYTLINREDDMGQEGLRRAKMSYRPVRLIKKYYCRPI